MKLDKILITILFAALAFSCKEGQKEEVKVVEKNQHIIILKAVVRKDDVFQVYYKETNDDKAPYEEVNSLRVDVKGSESPQDIIFNLPEDRYPTFLRVDFGSNKEQGDMVVKQFSISFRDKKFSIKDSQFFDYFIEEKANVKFDKFTSKVIPLNIKEGYYDPMFFSNSSFNAEMIKLSK